MPVFAMVDLLVIEHLIDAIYSAILRLEKAIERGNTEEENRLRTLIFDLQQNLDKLTKI